MRLTSLLCAIALIPSGAALAQSLPADDAERVVDYELREGDRLVATQTLTLELGRTASVSVGGAYSVRVRLERAAGDGGAYLVRSSLARAGSVDGTRLAAPDMTVTRGLPARAQLASNLSVGVTVR